MMYSIGLGADIEPTKLQQITNVANGYHQVQATLSATTLFDLETFYFKIFAHATDMDLVLDPTYAVNLTNPGPIVVAKAGIISSDQSATFLVLDDPILRQFYDLEFVSPQNNVIVPGVTIGGIPVQEARRHTYRLYRIVFPDVSLAHTYVGDWIVRLRPNGKWRAGRRQERAGRVDDSTHELAESFSGARAGRVRRGSLLGLPVEGGAGADQQPAGRGRVAHGFPDRSQLAGTQGQCQRDRHVAGRPDAQRHVVRRWLARRPGCG